MPHSRDPSAVPPHLAHRRLVAGNRRFLAREGEPRFFSHHPVDEDQRPFAIVVGCSDSRTPVEILFDQGFGDLFVVRVAGNIAAPSVIGSVEFAAAQFGTRLVVVLGHTRCGAVSATVDSLATGNGPASRNIRFITDRIAPHVEALVRGASPHGPDRAAIMAEAVRANVRAAAYQLRHGSRLLEELVRDGRIVVVTAEYELETGLVHFFGPLPPPPLREASSIVTEPLG